MSGSLLEIKKKIKGVQNTRKITKAMQLVAASKMRQFQKRATKAREFVVDLKKIVDKNTSENSKNIFAEKREKGKTLFVLYTSDKGLCGALNTKLINSLFRSDKWIDMPEKERMLITIGKKSSNYAKSNKIPVTKEFIGISEKLSNLEAIEIIDEIIELWRKNLEIKEVIFIAPHYESSFVFYPKMKTYLPLGQDIELEDKIDDKDYMYQSPSEEEVINKLYEQLIQAAFIQAFLELKASEYSSRMIAMQNATDAADKMTNQLKLTFNKARQQAITQEIAELIGAKMALEEEE